MSRWNIRCNILQYTPMWIGLLVHEVDTVFLHKGFFRFKKDAYLANFEMTDVTLTNVFDGPFLMWLKNPTCLPFNEENITLLLRSHNLNYEPYINIPPYDVEEKLIRSEFDNFLRAKIVLKTHPDLHENYISYI